MRPWVLLASLALACGDNRVPGGPDLAQTAELVVVAHPGDELLLMQPDLLEAVQRGGLTTVYLAGAAPAEREGLLAAYGHAAQRSDWQCGEMLIVDRSAHHCRLDAPNLSLVFLDGDQASAGATLIRVVRVTNPDVVRTLEITSTHGADDAAHASAGRKTVLALAATNRSVRLISYRGDGIVDEPPNKLTPVFDAAFAMLARFEACTAECAACGDACTAVDDVHVDRLLRRYAVGFRHTGGGQLRLSNECLGLGRSLESCTTAPVWTLDGSGELRTDNGCLAVTGTGELALLPCLGGDERRWFVDDDGHVMTAAASALRCLTARGGVARLEPCDADNDPRWELVPPTLTTPRSGLGITATGRDVRLADVDGDGRADLCAVEAGELHCARGMGTGTFQPATRIDDVTAPLAIDTRSLTFGDVDGDGRADACGRNEAGGLCATAGTGFRAAPLSPAFDVTHAVATSSASLTAIDSDGDGIAELCGVDAQGLVCAFASSVFDGSLRSTWPEPDAVVWFGDLDGDDAADWCTATDTGPACAVWSERDLTMEGTPWGYSLGGAVEVTPATTATVALGDIDRDGRADLCSLRDDRIVCARSLGRSFGPRFTLAILPNQTTASALWLGDLDGDGRADPCVDTGTEITCARQP